jgi:hypothetical protein
LGEDNIPKPTGNTVDLVEDWVALLRNYARAFSGYELDFTEADWKKLQDQNSVLFTLFANTEAQPNFPVCLVPALEVEAYLRGHNYKQALIATYTFMENVKKDALHILAPKYNQHLDVISGKVPKQLSSLFNDKKQAFITGKSNTTLTDELCKKEKFANSVEIIKNFYPKKIDEKNIGESPFSEIRNLRNKLSHSRATTQDLEALLVKAEEADIWKKNHDNGYSLLTSPSVIDVINEHCNGFSPATFKNGDKDCETWQEVFNTMLSQLETQIKNSSLKTKALFPSE